MARDEQTDEYYSTNEARTHGTLYNPPLDEDAKMGSTISKEKAEALFKKRMPVAYRRQWMEFLDAAGDKEEYTLTHVFTWLDM